jgi:hypothetical protein
MKPSGSRDYVARTIPYGWHFVVCMITLMAAIALAAPCAYAKGKPGPFVKLSGTVSNSLTGLPVAGAKVTLTATGTTLTYTTAADGTFSDSKVQVGTYDMSVTAANFEPYAKSLSLLKGSLDVPVPLVPSTPVVVSVSMSAPTLGATRTATGTISILDPGCSVLSAEWKAVPPAANIVGSSSGSTVTVALSALQTDWAQHLVQVSELPPISKADLEAGLGIQLQPYNVVRKGTQNRNQVLAVNPFTLEEGERVPLTYTAKAVCPQFQAEDVCDGTTPIAHCREISGSPSATVPDLPWVVSTGVKTVPLNVPVMLLGKCDGQTFNEDTGVYECPAGTTFQWQITASPALSSAALTGDQTRSPWFTPDQKGVYEISVDQKQGMTVLSSATLQLYAGNYLGVIKPDDTLTALELLQISDPTAAYGPPVPDGGCLGCHKPGGSAPDKFAPWRLTGHAEAFTQNITSTDHFGESCFACHTVGYNTNPTVINGGIDDTPNYDGTGGFLDLMLGNQAMYEETKDIDDLKVIWPEMLAQMPDTARRTNIQCENCHGPQDTDSTVAGFPSSSHGANYVEADPSNPIDPRVSLAADVCGSCHGEPARHGRFQQWQLSNHADYNLASQRGTGGNAGNCGRCHSGNGFVAWSKLPDPFDPGTEVTVTWNADTVVPQVCAACHDPHDAGNTSGTDETNAKVRLMGDTNILLAGFQATAVGKGATCMTCHNSRGGVEVAPTVSLTGWIGRNDTTWSHLDDAQKAGNESSPHHGVQADLIMGQNMYFFTSEELQPGAHYNIEDTCIGCHMEKTDPPDILSYNRSGTNHTFAADPTVCANSGCHAGGEPNADTVDNQITENMSKLETALGAAYMRLMTKHYPVVAGGGCSSADGTPDHEITSVTWSYGGRNGATLDLTVSDGTNSTSCTGRLLSQITVDGGTNLQTFVLNPTNGVEDLLKARWNYGMNYEDETINGCADEFDPTCHPPHTHRGVHNHNFQLSSLTRAITHVNAVAFP